LLLFAMATANTAGHTKKVVVNAMTLIGFAVGNVAAPQFYKTSQAPRYGMMPCTLVWGNHGLTQTVLGLGIGSLCVSLGLCFITYIALWLYLVWQNKRRTPARLAAMETAPDNIEFMDLTDKQNPLFVYVY
jgi:MFS transporter, ACS family, allantoate permease